MSEEAEPRLPRFPSLADDDVAATLALTCGRRPRQPLSPWPTDDSDDWPSSHWLLLRKQRGAALDALAERRRIAVRLGQALDGARCGWLKPDWRERGLDEAVASGHSGEVWVWMQIVGFARRYWEPGVAAALGVPWHVALASWLADTLMMLREQEETNKASVSRWAGFHVIDATQQEWESLLDEGHSGPWPERIGDVKGRWSIGFHAHMLLKQLDRCEFAYDSGLAAGGRDVDWIGRHRERVGRWRFTGDRADELGRLDRAARLVESGDPHLPYGHHLPAYWRPS